MEIIGVIIGIIVGGAACWAIRGARSGSELARQRNAQATTIASIQQENDAKNASLNLSHQQELSGKDAEIARLNGQLEQVTTAQELLETAKAQFSETAKLTASEAMQRNNQQFLELAQENIGKTIESVKGEFNERHQQFQELVKPLTENYSQLTETFQTTANRALATNSEQFLELAKENMGKTLESAKGEFQQRHTQFQELVKPLSENYGKLNPQIESLMNQNRSLIAETTKLSSALTDNRQVGRWGEMQLRRVVELAGMADYCDFVEQESINGSQGRPDLIVNLPEGRSIIVDAKASTLAYMDAQQAEDEESANSSLSRHAQAMKNQIDSLVSRKYGADSEGYLDFVVMFVPGDQFLAAALSSNPSLVEYAMSKRVAIATPSSLISMLWAVANGWQQHRLAADAAEIKKAGEEMHKRMMTFIGYYQSVGKELEQAVSAYNRSIGSFDSRLAPQGREFTRLLTGSEGGFKGPEKLDISPRVSAYALPPAIEEAPDD